MPTWADTAAIMVSSRHFASMGHEHMAVGHTHQDVGAWLSPHKLERCFSYHIGVCKPVPLCLDAFFGMVSKLIRQADETMQP